MNLPEIKKIFENVNSIFQTIETLLRVFGGSNMESAYFVLAEKFEEVSTSLEKIKPDGNTEIKLMIKKSFETYRKFSDEFDEKCKLSPEEENKKLDDIKEMKKKLEKIGTECDSKNVEEKLYEIFIKTHELDSGSNILVKEERQKLLELLKESMFDLERKSTKVENAKEELEGIQEDLFNLTKELAFVTDKDFKEKIEQYCAQIQDFRIKCDKVTSSGSSDVRTKKRKLLNYLDEVEKNLDNKHDLIKKEKIVDNQIVRKINNRQNRSTSTNFKLDLNYAFWKIYLCFNTEEKHEERTKQN